MPRILKEYINYLAIKNFSYNTIKSYTNDLMIFFKYLIEYWDLIIEEKDINIFILLKVKESDIISFVVYLNYYRNNSSATRKRRVNAIISFFKWLIYKFPTYNIKVPIKAFWIEETERLPKYLKLDEVKQIKNIFNISNSRNPVRDNLIIDMLLITGIRIKELSNINIEDINFKDKYINIIAKGNKERQIYINEYLKHKLLEYTKDKNKPLFLNIKGQRLGTDGIERICKKAFYLIGRKDCSAHALRHTSATLMYKYKPDIVLLREFLGHKSVTTTEIYTHLDNERLKNAVNHNPLNKIA